MYTLDRFKCASLSGEGICNCFQCKNARNALCNERRKNFGQLCRHKNVSSIRTRGIYMRENILESLYSRIMYRGRSRVFFKFLMSLTPFKCDPTNDRIINCSGDNVSLFNDYQSFAMKFLVNPRFSNEELLAREESPEKRSRISSRRSKMIISRTVDYVAKRNEKQKQLNPAFRAWRVNSQHLTTDHDFN